MPANRSDGNRGGSLDTLEKRKDIGSEIGVGMLYA